MPVFTKKNLEGLDFARLKEHHVLRLVMWEWDVCRKDHETQTKEFIYLADCTRPTLSNAIAGKGYIGTAAWNRIVKATGTILYDEWVKAQK